METRSNHILVGGVVLAIIVALLGFIVWLSQVSGSDKKEYDIFFKQAVDGLAKGSSVAFNGVPVGQITSISLEPKTPEFVRVRITVDNDTPVLEGTTAIIQGVGFTGVSQIQLDPGTQRGAPPLACPDDNPLSQCPYGVPVIPTKPGALTSLLSSAPELLERFSTLTERLTELLSDKNQASIAGILAHVDKISGSLADRGPEIAATLAEARVAIKQAGAAADQFGRLADTSNKLFDEQGRPMLADLRKTLAAAQASMANLNATLGDARPGVQAFSKQTLPEIGALVRDLRATSASLRDVTEKVQQGGAGSLIGGSKLPDYKPGK